MSMNRLGCIAALFTRMSSRPHLSMIASTMAESCAASVTSARQTKALGSVLSEEVEPTSRRALEAAEELTGQSRSKNTVMARQVSMHLMRTLTNLPLTAIGEHHGGRNHATVLSSIRKVEELLKSDPSMAGVIRDITSNITTNTGSL